MNGYCSLMLIYSRKGRKWLISSFKIMKMNHSLWLKQVIISINTAWNLNFYLLWCGKNLFVFKSEKQIKILQGKSQNGKCTGSFIVYFCYNWGLKLAYKTKCQLFYSCLIHPFTNTLIQQHFLYLTCFLSNIYTPMNAVGATQGSVSCSTILKYTEAGRDRTTNLPVSRWPALAPQKTSNSYKSV